MSWESSFLLPSSTHSIMLAKVLCIKCMLDDWLNRPEEHLHESSGFGNEQRREMSPAQKSWGHDCEKGGHCVVTD